MCCKVAQKPCNKLYLSCKLYGGFPESSGIFLGGIPIQRIVVFLGLY